MSGHMQHSHHNATNSKGKKIPRESASEDSSLEENKAIYRRFIQLMFNEGRSDQWSVVLSPSYVYHDAPPGTPEGPEAVVQVVKMFRAAFPDLEIKIEQQVAEGEFVCSRTITRGTHKGEIFGIAPTDKAITMGGMTLARVVDGHIVESWVKNDVLGLMKQLGAL